MTAKTFRRLVLPALAALLATPAFAAPVLRSDVLVQTPIVTVADMFEDAGAYAEEPLFRAPAPGTTGRVDIGAVRTAAARIGLSEFQNPGILSVSVARDGILVDETLLADLMAADLTRRGVLVTGMSVDFMLRDALPVIHASTGASPASLVSLRYMPNSGQFTARFDIEGRRAPLDIAGRADISLDVPHLKSAMRSGDVIAPDDVEMRPVLVRFADTGDVASYDQVIGMQLRRSSREGLMLRPGDLEEPRLIGRNDTVTLSYRSGPMTLTVRGRALADAARGDTVPVLNLMSNKVVTGLAADHGLVEISAPHVSTASL